MNTLAHTLTGPARETRLGQRPSAVAAGVLTSVVVVLGLGALVLHAGVAPPLLAVLLLVLGAEFVNGWTDAPNAIATVVGTRSLSPRWALLMASVFNLVGVFSGTAVAATIGTPRQSGPGCTCVKRGNAPPVHRGTQ